MIRYRCPHCTALIAAHERRVGQSSVCKGCLKPHPIPADAALWLTETGEPLHPAPAPEPEPAPRTEVVPISVVAPYEPEREPAPTVPELKLPVLVPVEPSPVASSERSAAPSAVAVSELESEPPAVGIVTPAPSRPAAPALVRQNRHTAPAPAAPPAASRPRPAFAEPVQLQTQADIAAALTAALTSRMKPPAAPRRDLRPSTAAWMLLTAAGLALALMALFGDPSYRWAALGLGAAQVLAGYLWIVRLTHLRDPRRGLACAIPLLTPYYLIQHKYAKLRPLRFALTGLAIIALALAVPALTPLTGPLVKGDPPPPPPPDVGTQSQLVQLRTYRDKSAYNDLLRVLAKLVVTDPINSADAPDRASLAVDLEELCGHHRTDVRVAAMSALVSWDTTPNALRARGVCVRATGSKFPDERMRALVLLPRWKDADAARAVQARIGSPEAVETAQAAESLREIGGEHAEQAALALLRQTNDPGKQLIALDILSKCGGAGAVAELSQFAGATEYPSVRTQALKAVRAIEERLAAPKGPGWPF